MTNNIGAIEQENSYEGGTDTNGKGRATKNEGYIFYSNATDDLLEVGSTAEEIWRRKYGTELWFIYDVDSTSDLGSIFAARLNGEQHLMRLDSQGNNVWTRSVSALGLGTPFVVRENSDGGFVVGGITAGITGTPTTVLNTDALGNIKWRSSFKGNSGR